MADSEESFGMKAMTEALHNLTDKKKESRRRGWTMYDISTVRPNSGVLLKGVGRAGKVRRIPIDELSEDESNWVRLWVMGADEQFEECKALDSWSDVLAREVPPLDLTKYEGRNGFFIKYRRKSLKKEPLSRLREAVKEEQQYLSSDQSVSRPDALSQSASKSDSDTLSEILLEELYETVPLDSSITNTINFTHTHTHTHTHTV